MGGTTERNYQPFSFGAIFLLVKQVKDLSIPNLTVEIPCSVLKQGLGFKDDEMRKNKWLLSTTFTKLTASIATSKGIFKRAVSCYGFG